MRILVVDDIYVIEAGVARAVEGRGGHTVVGARSPAELRDLLERDSDFQLAFVDLHYGRGARESGLAALEALERYDIPSAVHTVDGEDNRMLYLLAAFEFFPRTTAVLSKHAGDEAIHHIVDALSHGHRPGPGSSQRYRPPRGGPSLLHRLVTRGDDLRLWNALARHNRLSLIAREAHCSERTVSEFIAQRQPVIEEFHLALLDRPLPEEPRGGARNKPLLEVCRFAQFNADFFADRDVARLAAQWWDRKRGGGRG